MKPLALALLLIAACAQQRPPAAFVNADTSQWEGQIVQAYAGQSAGGTRYYYLIDKRIRACWFSTSYRVPSATLSGYATDTLAPLDCCQLHRVPELVPELGFATCAEAAAP